MDLIQLPRGQTMSSSSPPEPARPFLASAQLLFGLVALQTGFVTSEQLVAAFHAWTTDKSRPLPDILESQQALTSDDRQALERLVTAFLNKHGGDAEKSLAALSSIADARPQLERLHDPDVCASLAHVSKARPPDPNVTETATLIVKGGPYDPVDPLDALLLRRFPVVRRILLDADVARHPTQYRVTAVRQFPGEDQFLQLLCRRIHAGVTLAERHDLEPVPFELRCQLRCVPAVYGDLAEVVALPEFVNALADHVVVDDFTRSGLNVLLPDPLNVRHAVATFTLPGSLFRHPEERKHVVTLVSGKHQHQRRDVGGRC